MFCSADERVEMTGRGVFEGDPGQAHTDDVRVTPVVCARFFFSAEDTCHL